MDTALSTLAAEIVKLARKYIVLGKKYWDLTHPFFEEEKVPQTLINEAFNKWNWAEKELFDKVKEYEDLESSLKTEADRDTAQKIFNTTMEEDRKEFTRFTLETSYGDKTIKEMDTEDPDIEDCVHAFYTLMIGSTWQARTILEGMRDFAESMLKTIEPDATH